MYLGIRIDRKPLVHVVCDVECYSVIGFGKVLLKKVEHYYFYILTSTTNKLYNTLHLQSSKT